MPFLFNFQVVNKVDLHFLCLLSDKPYMKATKMVYRDSIVLLKSRMPPKFVSYDEMLDNEETGEM